MVQLQDSVARARSGHHFGVIVPCSGPGPPAVDLFVPFIQAPQGISNPVVKLADVGWCGGRCGQVRRMEAAYLSTIAFGEPLAAAAGVDAASRLTDAAGLALTGPDKTSLRSLDERVHGAFWWPATSREKAAATKWTSAPSTSACTVPFWWPATSRAGAAATKWPSSRAAMRASCWPMCSQQTRPRSLSPFSCTPAPAFCGGKGETTGS